MSITHSIKDMLHHHHHHHHDDEDVLKGLDLASPLYSGYMYKEAHIHHLFHRRYFVLFPRLLVYYEKESAYKHDVAAGKLEHLHRALRLKDMYLTKPDKKPKGAKFCFILHAPDPKNQRQEVLLVTETKEQRKHWVEKLQAQNPDLLEANHHRPAINPDTPQLPHRILSHEDSPPTTSVSPLITTSVSAMNHHEEGSHDYHARPGSPRHCLHRPSTESHDSLHLDIQHLNIGEGLSDVEDN